jgi:hypothetical protein
MDSYLDFTRRRKVVGMYRKVVVDFEVDDFDYPLIDRAEHHEFDPK